MKCMYCGYEGANDLATCPQCGAAMPQPAQPTYAQPVDPAYAQPAQPTYAQPVDPAYAQPAQPTYAQPAQPIYAQPMYAQPISAHPVHAFLLSFLRDKLFLIIAIFCSAGTALGLIFGGSVDVIGLLMTIFMWLVYSKATKNEVDRNNLRRISGTVYAMYIIVNILAIMLIVCGLLIALMMGLAATALPNELFFEFDMGEIPTGMLDYLLGVGGIVLGGVVVLIGVGVLLISLFGYRKLHRFAKSLYESVDTLQFRFDRPQTARNWLMAFGVLEAVTALGSLSNDVLSGLPGVCSAVCLILGSVLVKKYFLAPQPQYQPPQY